MIYVNSILIFGNSIKASEEEDFDPKIQLNEYLSYSDNLVDYQLGKFDDDNNLDLAVAFSDLLAIYEESDNEFEKVWEISTGDDGFIGSNITSLGLGDLIGRQNQANLNSLDEINSVSNSTNCEIIDPIPNDLAYLTTAEDGNYYTVNYTSGGKGNFSIVIDTGLMLDSFELTMRLGRNDNDQGTTVDFSLWIYDNENSKWEKWRSLKNDILVTPQEITNSSNDLSQKTQNYISEDNELELKILYDDTDLGHDPQIILDYIDLSAISVTSTKDLIVGGGEGEVYVLECWDSNQNEYSITQGLSFGDYGTGSAGKRQVTSLNIGDINNDDKDNILIGNRDRYVYALEHDITASNDYDNLVTRMATTTDSSITSISSVSNSTHFTMCVGTTSGSYFLSSYEYGSGDFFRPLLENNVTGVEINDLSIKDLNGNGKYEVVVGSIDKKIRIFDSSFKSIYQNSDLVGTGNEILSVATGDFAEKNNNLLAFGSSQDRNKIRILDPKKGYSTYWNSSFVKGINEYNFIREDLLSMKAYSQSDKDILLVATKRHIMFLSTDYTDTDGDKISDLSERTFFRTFPDESDSDGDGLSDGVEIFVYGTDPMDSDSDGDLIPDGMEISLNMDPLDPMSSLLLIILIPTIIALISVVIFYLTRQYLKQKKADYERVKNTPNLMPQVRRLIIQRLEGFADQFEGFESKGELRKFNRNLTTELMSIVLDRLYNFLEYLRLKGIVFTDAQEEILRDIVEETLEPVEESISDVIKTLLAYETRYKQFDKAMNEALEGFQDWKKPATKAKGKVVVEELRECPECKTLGPKDSAFCLECGAKLKK